MNRKMTKHGYLRAVYAQLTCTHCGNAQGVILHHPNNDGHLGRWNDIPADAPDLLIRLGVEIARCIPLCRSCHGVLRRLGLRIRRVRLLDLKASEVKLPAGGRPGASKFVDDAECTMQGKHHAAHTIVDLA